MRVYPCHKSGSYLIDFSYLDGDGKRCRYRKTAGRGVNQKQANKMARELYRRLQMDPRSFEATFARRSESTGEVALSGLAEQFWTQHVEQRLTPATKRVYFQMLKVHLLPFFEGKDLRTVEPGDIEGFVRRQRGLKLSPKTINNQLSLLRTLLQRGVRDGHLPSNPMKDIKNLRVDQQETLTFTAQEVEQYLASIRKHDAAFYGVFLCAVRCGLRLGELTALRWQDVDLKTRWLWVRRAHSEKQLSSTKGKKSRKTFMPDDLLAFLSEVPPQERVPTAFVFQNAHGEHMTRDQLKHPHERACADLGKRIRMHDLRHTFGSLQALRGTPMHVLQRLLGHTDLTTTMRYLHTSEEEIRAAMTGSTNSRGAA